MSDSSYQPVGLMSAPERDQPDDPIDVSQFQSSALDTFDFMPDTSKVGGVLQRSADRLLGWAGVAPDMISSDEANKKYGITPPSGAKPLVFNDEVPESVAKSLYDEKRAELMRNAVLAQRPSGVAPWLATQSVNMLSMALDPLDVASAFVPGLGEARLAGMAAKEGASAIVGWLGRAGMEEFGVAGRAGVRALEGGTGAALGQVPLSALRYGMSKEEQSDYSALDALADVGMGAVFGGVLHPLGGAVADLLTGRFAANPTARFLNANPDAREAALKASVAQMTQGQPVNVEPLINATRAQAVEDLEKERVSIVSSGAGKGYTSAQLSRLNDITAQLDQLLRPVEEGAPTAAPPAPRFLGREWILKAGERDGGYDMGKGGAALAAEAEAALKEGHTVELVTDGGRKTVPIVKVERGQLRDAYGAPWGSAWIAADNTGTEGLRITPKEAVGTAPKRGATEATGATPSVTTTTENVVRVYDTPDQAERVIRAADLQGVRVEPNPDGGFWIVNADGSPHITETTTRTYGAAADEIVQKGDAARAEILREAQARQTAANTPLAQHPTEEGRTAALADLAAKEARKGLEGEYKAAMDEAPGLEAWAAEQQRALGVTPELEDEPLSPAANAFRAELAAVDEPVQEAQSFVQAAMAAMNCLIRGGSSGA